MSLASKLQFQFDRSVQFRGVRLFNSRLVRVKDSGPSHLSGEVMGGSLYDARLQYDGERVLAFCDCPYFNDHGECKHLWAAVLEADRLGALREAYNARYLTLEPDYGSPDPELSPLFLGQPSRPILPPPTQAPLWEENLAMIQRALENKKPQSANWPREFEILYAIDVTASKSCGAIVLDLFSRTRKKSGEWSTYKDFRVTAAQAGSLPDPTDAEAIAAIFGGQDYYAYQYSFTSGGPSHKALPPVLALKLLPLVSATGRLALRTSVAYSDFQPATWDAGEPWKLWLEVRQDDRDQWNITGSLRRGEERMDLSEPLLLLESGFVILKGRIARFDPSGAFPWVAQLRDVK